jgi:adenylate cyclase
LLKKAIRLNPFSPTWYFSTLGHAYPCAGQFEESVSAYQKALQRSPDNYFAHVGLTAAYSQAGREKEARAEVAEFLRINPKFSLDSFKMPAYKDQSQTDKYANALRKAGLKWDRRQGTNAERQGCYNFAPIGEFFSSKGLKIEYW